MKILAISNLFPPAVLGGYELACDRVCNELISRGHQVSVITASTDHFVSDALPRVPTESISRCLALNEYFPTSLPPASHQILSKISNVENVRTILVEIQKSKPDIVFLWNQLGLGALSIIDSLEELHVPFVWRLGDRTPFQIYELDPILLNTTWLKSRKRTFNSNIILCSRRLRREIETLGITLSGNVRIVNNWADPAPLEFDRQYWTTNTAKPLRIAFVGSIEEAKGIHILFEAAGLLKNKARSNFEIHLFGRGDLDLIRSSAKKFSCENLVTNHGYVDLPNLKKMLGEMDCLAFPTWEREPFGFSVLDAASMGCLPIITSTAGVAECLINEKDCLKIDRDAKALSKQIERILDGKINLSTFGKHLVRKVRDQFSFASAVTKIEKVLEESRFEYEVSQEAAEALLDDLVRKESLLFDEIDLLPIN